MADTKGGLVRFVAEAERHDMPVKFLKLLLHSSYSYSSFGSSSFVLPTFNHMVLEKNVIDAVTPLSLAAPRGEMPAIQTIYHEATHAWLDLRADDPEVSALMQEGTKHYKAAPLTRGTAKADDPDRIFHEAMGSYVGHRPSAYWGALESLTFVDTFCAKGVPPDKRARLIAMAKRARADYESAMAQRVFGYQNGPGAFSTFREQNETTRPITNKMKEFCDRVLLEGKIPDQFDRKAPLAELWAQAADDVLSGSRMRFRPLTICLVACLTVAGVRANSNPCEDIQAELRTIDGAIDIYVVQHGQLPARERWLAALKRENLLQRNFPEQDKWGHPFHYEPQAQGDYDLRSVGADGQWGTEDDQLKADGWRWRRCSSTSGC